MTTLVKPLLRGHFHQAAFFTALGACLMLVANASSGRATWAALVYSLGLTGLLGISALYHRPQWGVRARLWMRRLDHAFIFLSISCTATPFCLLALPEETGASFLKLMWAVAAAGVVVSLFWAHAPKWVTAGFCLAGGWAALPYMPAFAEVLPTRDMLLIFGGGFMHTLGGIIYALKRPNPWPRVFGYHEIFHILVVIGAFMHFVVIRGLLL